METKEEYNWWTDPKNKEQVDKISWWNHPENREIVQLPISTVGEKDIWVAATSDETKKYLGDISITSTQGKTKEEAILRLFDNLQFMYKYQESQRLRFERWVPIILGPWRHIGGRWITIFGFNIYFRTCTSRTKEFMKGGWFIPFTNLNISVSNRWKSYKNWKKKNKW